MPNLRKEFGGKKVAWLTVNSTNANHPEFKTPINPEDVKTSKNHVRAALAKCWPGSR